MKIFCCSHDGFGLTEIYEGTSMLFSCSICEYRILFVDSSSSSFVGRRPTNEQGPIGPPTQSLTVRRLNITLHTHTHSHTHRYIYIYNIYTYIYKYIYKHIYTYVYIYLYIYVYMCVLCNIQPFVSIYSRTYIQLYIYIYMIITQFNFINKIKYI